jgi:hypothetical protein
MMWLIAALSALIGFVLISVAAVRQPSAGQTGLLLVAFAAVSTVFMVRRYALALQDRIIRLEMQTRLTRLGRSADFARLTKPQVIALRFASDAELPALMDRAIAENLSADQIKRAVTAWQPDLMRT